MLRVAVQTSDAEIPQQNLVKATRSLIARTLVSYTLVYAGYVRVQPQERCDKGYLGSFGTWLWSASIRFDFAALPASRRRASATDVHLRQCSLRKLPGVCLSRRAQRNYPVYFISLLVFRVFQIASMTVLAGASCSLRYVRFSPCIVSAHRCRASFCRYRKCVLAYLPNRSGAVDRKTERRTGTCHK
jgi:hypothetical protein